MHEVLFDETHTVEAAVQMLNDARAAYCQKFGEGSLERVLYIDPVNATYDDFEEAAKYLRKAIRKNKPIEQIPQEIWDGLVF